MKSVPGLAARETSVFTFTSPRREITFTISPLTMPSRRASEA